MTDIEELKKLAETALRDLSDEAMGNGNSLQWAANRTERVTAYIERLQRELEEARKDAEPSHRYKVVDGSQSGHCCFTSTVVDTTKPIMIGEKHYNNEYEPVCETFEEEDAELICRALNSARQQQG